MAERKPINRQSDVAIDPRNWPDADPYSVRPGEGAGVTKIPRAKNQPLVFPDYQDEPEHTLERQVMKEIINQLVPGAVAKRRRFMGENEDVLNKGMMDRIARTDSQLGMTPPNIFYWMQQEALDKNAENIRNKYFGGFADEELIYKMGERLKTEEERHRGF